MQGPGSEAGGLKMTAALKSNFSSLEGAVGGGCDATQKHTRTPLALENRLFLHFCSRPVTHYGFCNPCKALGRARLPRKGILFAFSSGMIQALCVCVVLFIYSFLFPPLLPLATARKGGPASASFSSCKGRQEWAGPREEAGSSRDPAPSDLVR